MADEFLLKGQTLSFTGDPFRVAPEAAIRHHAKGAVWVKDGVIHAVGPADEIEKRARGISVTDYGDALIMAGFVDCHTHYPQSPIIASYGEQLLEWLNKYTFPTEMRFKDPAHAQRVADFFLDEALRNGITTACVYCTVHPQSVDAFFEAAAARNLRMAAGKVLMDRNAPAGLCDDAQSGYDQSSRLIGRWHGRGRLIYAITPRFAITSTPAQLEAAGALWREHPTTLMQTHLSENEDEIVQVAALYPNCKDYFAVYEKYGLTGPGAIFGHGVHLTGRERAAIRDSGSGIAHCPTSNMFIGSGLFDLEGMKGGEHPVPVGLATDVAGGSSFSMFATMRSAYEVAQLRGRNLHPARALYLSTLGSAAVMGLDGVVGNLAAGYEADMAVFDLTSRAIIGQRMEGADDILDQLFVQIVLADDRATVATYSGGRKVHARPAPA